MDFPLVPNRCQMTYRYDTLGKSMVTKVYAIHEGNLLKQTICTNMNICGWGVMLGNDNFHLTIFLLAAKIKYRILRIRLAIDTVMISSGT